MTVVDSVILAYCAVKTLCLLSILLCCITVNKKGLVRQLDHEQKGTNFAIIITFGEGARVHKLIQSEYSHHGGLMLVLFASDCFERYLVQIVQSLDVEPNDDKRELVFSSFCHQKTRKAPNGARNCCARF